MKLTGRRRYREEKRLFRRPLLVLQVEYQDRVYDGFGGLPVNRWRDATVSDLITIEAMHSPFPVLEAHPHA